MRSVTRFSAVLLGLATLVAMGCTSKPPDSTDAVGDAETNETETNEGETNDAKTGEAETNEAETNEAKMIVEKKSFGKTEDGTEVDHYTLTNDNGLKVGIMTYGATITSVDVPDRDGKFANVTLFRDSLAKYIEDSPYFGCVAGRYANRIAKGKFTLDDKEYSLTINNGENHLHGGTVGFDKLVWKAEPNFEADGSVSVCFSLTSPDGDQGYPGTLTSTVTYSLNNDNELKMEYTATTDKPTVLNLTNHAYWNLAGAGSGDILGHELTIVADRFLPVDAGLIPTGKLDPVADSPMDFTKPEKIGARIDQVEGGYDHCYVINESDDEGLTLCARVVEPTSGRVMEIRTSQPAIQLYTGNFLDGKISGGGVDYQKHFAFCLETQHYPDAPNQPDFPSTVLRPGEKYSEVTVHKFTVQEK